MKPSLLSLVLGAVLAVALLSAGSVLAQAGGSTDTAAGGITDAPAAGTVGTNANVHVSLPNPLGANSTICSLLHRIIDWMVVIGAPIATGMIMIGAFQMMFAAGQPEKIATARRTIIYVAIGYAIILIGWGFVFIIADVLGVKGIIC